MSAFIRMSVGVAPRPHLLVATRSRAFAAKSAAKKPAPRRRKTIPRGQLYVPPPEGAGAPKLKISKVITAAEEEAKNKSFVDKLADQPAFVILGVFPVAAMGLVLLLSEELREQAYERWLDAGLVSNKRGEKGLVNVHNDN